MSASLVRTFVVVGAAGGVGIEVLRQLPADARVIAIVQNQEQLGQIAGLARHGIACDLADAASVATTLAAIEQLAPERIDGLVFCAAMQPLGPVELIRRAELEQLFAINVFGTLQLVQGLIPALRRARGRIVLFSSMVGRVAAPILGAYAATKFSLEALADALRRELRASGVSVSLIEPSGIKTPMATAQSGLVEQALATLDEESLRRYGPLYRGYRAMTQKGMRIAAEPGYLARIAVAAATGGATPKTRYVVGIDAKILIALGRWLPTRWFDALLMKMTLGS